MVLHVSSIFLDIFWIMWSILEHVYCHCSSVNWFLVNRLVNSFRCIAFSPKNLVLNFSRFSRGMGFIILVILVVGWHATNVFGGM